MGQWTLERLQSVLLLKLLVLRSGSPNADSQGKREIAAHNNTRIKSLEPKTYYF